MRSSQQYSLPKRSRQSFERYNLDIIFLEKRINQLNGYFFTITHSVHRVRNEYGPQTISAEYTDTLDKLMFTSPTKIKLENNASTAPSRIEERLVNAERFLNIKTEGSRNIYERIKNIEDRILHLETVSPEYNHFLVSKFHICQN